MLGPCGRRLIVGYFIGGHLFRKSAHRAARFVFGFSPSADYRAETTHPLDFIGLALFGSGVALLSYVLEVFGEHTLGWPTMLGLLAISAVLLTSYGLHAHRASSPCSGFSLFRIRSFRAAVSGSYFTRLALAASRFYFLCSTRSASDLHPSNPASSRCRKAIAAMSLKLTMASHPAAFGYRTVLVSNTIILGFANHTFLNHRRRHSRMAHRR